MAVIEIAKIQVRRGQENQTGIPTLAGGEFAWAADTEHLYIGLRREDGGSRDANVRILTENDLFEALGTTATEYTYRAGSGITSETGSVLTEVERTIQGVLDEAYVSVRHFGAVGDENNDDTASLQLAINRLFFNDLSISPDPGRRLVIPAGTYNVTATILLPSNTVLVGEGVDKTVINLVSTATHAFQTVDQYGFTFDTTATMDSNAQPRSISMSNMTIQYDDVLTTVSQSLSLLSLDCVVDANLKNIKFKGHRQAGDGSDETYTGVDIRGFNMVTTENIRMDNCSFQGLYNGVMSNYDITKPTIENSYFYNLQRGISFNSPKDPAASVGPRFARIINNKFEMISDEGFYAGGNDSNTGTYHLSKDNQFIDVGNGIYGELSSTGTAVIQFESGNNSSVDDYFSRYEAHQRSVANTGTETTFTYYPLVAGRTVIENSYVSTSTLSASPGPGQPTTATIVRLPITGSPQNISLKYSIFVPGTVSTSTTTITVDPGSAIDRMGQVEVYIPPGNVRAVAEDQLFVYDNFNFSGDNLINFTISWSVIVDDGYNYYDVILEHQSQNDITLEYQLKLMT